MNLQKIVDHARRLYEAPLVLEHDPINFRGKVPDVLKSDDYEKQEGSGLYLPPSVSDSILAASIGSYVSYSYKFTATSPPPRTPEKKEPPFEVNMMEALVGWKAFRSHSNCVSSASQGTPWPACEPMVAKCACRPPMRFITYADEKGEEIKPHKPCADIPRVSGSCGIYAGSSRAEVEQYCYKQSDSFFTLSPYWDESAFVGEIYGWGRYVRGDNGWRSQFAYPKCFYLRSSQVNFIDVLREFRVPIYIEQPMQVYNPREDGYNEYRQNEENWDLGTAADSSTTED